MKNAIILCSGGIDSVTTAYYVKKKLKYDNTIFLFFNYGQKTLEKERECSKHHARILNAKFTEIKLDWLGEISNSLINKKGRVNKLTRKDLKNTEEESKNWYVPCRNVIFLTHALALAESLFIKDKQIYDIFVGFKNEGPESYPDTTKEFVSKMNELSKTACSHNFIIKAPAINNDKEDIIQYGIKLGIDYKKTYTCYVGKKRHCGTCLSCQLRKAGFYWAGVEDVTGYGVRGKFNL